VVVVAKAFTPLLKYSFSDELPKVSVYVPIDNIETVAKEQVNVTFTKNSFDLIVMDFQGQDLRLTVTNLNDDINTETSKFLIRAGKIIVILRKASESSWSQLRKKE